MHDGDSHAQVRLSVAGMSVLLALALAAWEVYFFWYAGSFKGMEGKLGLFTPDRLGFNLAWLAAILSDLPTALDSLQLAVGRQPVRRRRGRHGFAGAARGRC